MSGHLKSQRAEFEGEQDDTLPALLCGINDSEGDTVRLTPELLYSWWKNEHNLVIQSPGDLSLLPEATRNDLQLL